jgi:hypothetical protein
MNRRQFAYVTAFGSAASSAPLSRNAARPQAARTPESAGLITEMVFLDDCVRLAMYDPALPAASKNALAGNADWVRSGALSPAAAEAPTPVLYALLAGRLFSEALMEQRKSDSAEARLYQDVAVLRDLARTAGCDPSKAAPVADLLELLHVRARLSLHTLNPDDENIHGWLEGVFHWWGDERDLRASIAAVYSAPDAAGMKEFGAGFYAPSDPLIRLARGFEFGAVVPPGGLAPALEHARQGSRYARALAAAAERLRQAPKLG